MGLIKGISSFFQSSRAATPPVEQARTPAMPTPEQSSKPLKASLLQTLAGGFSTRTKVEIAAVVLLISLRASTLAASGAPPVIATAIVVYILYKIAELSLRNILILGDKAVTTALFGQDPTQLDPADEMEAADVGVLHNAGAIGVFIIPNSQPSEVATLAPQEPAVLNDWAADFGGVFQMPEKAPLQPVTLPEPQEQEEETDSWAASMGGIFITVVHAFGILFLM
jgi:hypothetical protein